MTLHVEGLVDRPVELGPERLRTMPSVVDEVAAQVAGAVGEAVGVADIIAVASPAPDATHVTVIAADDSYRASVPLDALERGGWLAFGLRDGPLPEDKGGPYRLTVAEGTTLCWNVKNVRRLRFTAGPEPDDVPENPPH